MTMTGQQNELVNANGNLFVEACPGAGKTRAIVARFVRRAEEEPRKGIALLSFTNAAVDEVRSRCHDRTRALVVPNFIGTFDSFINRFVTRPLYVQQHSRTPRFIDSWRSTPKSSFRLRDMDRIPNLELDWFDCDSALKATLRSDRIPVRYQGTFAKIISTRRLELENRATWLYQNLVRDGAVTCAASRSLAAGYLQDNRTRLRIGTLLAARFSEVIVDEAQDCGPEELMILGVLKQFGVAIVAVADFDQSVFEFRRAEPEGVQAFANSIGEPLSLDGNFRSSPAICALNTSLRFSNRREIAEGENKSCGIRVQVAAFRRADLLAARIEELVSGLGHAEEQVMFLSHRGSDARTCAAVRETKLVSTNRVLGVAWAHSILRSSASSARDRMRAVELAERIIQAVVRSDDEGADDPGHGELDDRWLRQTAVRMAVSLGTSAGSGQEYASRIRTYLQSTAWPSGVKLKENLGSLIKTPKEDDWQASTHTERPGSFQAATIHSVKGREFAAVVTILPKRPVLDAKNRHAIDHWEDRTSSEVRRVLYVGASRAQKILVLAVHDDHVRRVINLLDRDNVPYDLHWE